MYKLIFILLFAIFAVSCEKEFTIKLPDEPVRPTLNSFMNQDSTIAVRATLSGRSEYFGGPSAFTEPENAVVKLYENDIYIETLHKITAVGSYDSTQIYKSNAKVIAGKRYKVTLEIPGYDMAEGENVIPNGNQIEISSKSIFFTPTEYGYNNTNFRFTITNKGSTAFNYRFRMHVDSTYYVDPATNDTTYDNYSSAIAIKTENNELSIFGDSYIDPVIGGIYSVQVLNPGESRIVTLTAENVSYYNGRFVLEASVLTDDSYNYLFSLNNILKNDDDPTAEKQNVICNVKNGFGIVGGMAMQEVVFK
jgi:archaellum component FlaF (FlaF/FlaG flagellin family)